MDFNGFLQELKRRDEFKYVRFSKPVAGENIVSMTGDIVGSDALDELQLLGRRYGIILMADEFSSWESMEYLRLYGRSQTRETRQGRST